MRTHYILFELKQDILGVVSSFFSSLVHRACSLNCLLFLCPPRPPWCCTPTTHMGLIWFLCWPAKLPEAPKSTAVRQLDLLLTAVALQGASCHDQAVFHHLLSASWLGSRGTPSPPYLSHQLAKATVDSSRFPSLITNSAFDFVRPDSKFVWMLSLYFREDGEGINWKHWVIHLDSVSSPKIARQREKRLILFRQWFIQNFISHTTYKLSWILLWASWISVGTSQSKPGWCL